MHRTSRRSLLRSLSCLPAALALPLAQAVSPTTTGFLNIHLRGPFTYLFFANPGRKEILIISPDPLNHHLPFISSQYSEAPIQRQDYVLAGVKPTSKPQPDWAGQASADILLEMSSSLDVDCKHKGATSAFSDECALYAGVNRGARLDLGLDYGPPMAGCQSLAEALKKRKPHGAMPPMSEDDKGHTGTDCKAGLLEIINVSDNVKLG